MLRQPLLGSSFGLVPDSMRRNQAWLKPRRRALCTVDCKRLFRRLDRGEGAPEVSAHQTLLSEVICGLRQPNVQTGALFTDCRWRLIRRFALGTKDWNACRLVKDLAPSAVCRAQGLVSQLEGSGFEPDLFHKAYYMPFSCRWRFEIKLRSFCRLVKG
jgi:hypothetical protein